jgi:Rad3-related DNA helicase
MVDVENSIIIFDEAHNVSNIAEEGSTFSLNQ